MNSKGKIIGDAELAWPDKKTALLMDYQLDESQSLFIKMGWQVITQETAMDAILKAVGGQ